MVIVLKYNSHSPSEGRIYVGRSYRRGRRGIAAFSVRAHSKIAMCQIDVEMLSDIPDIAPSGCCRNVHRFFLTLIETQAPHRCISHSTSRLPRLWKPFLFAFFTEDISTNDLTRYDNLLISMRHRKIAQIARAAAPRSSLTPGFFFCCGIPKNLTRPGGIVTQKVRGRKLAEQSDEMETRAVALRQGIARETEQIAGAQARKKKLEADLQNVERTLRRLRELQTAGSGLPKDVLDLRAEIIAKARKSKRRDITVENKEALEGEVKIFTARLRELCKHPFVFSYDGSEGSYGYDHDDGYPGHRVCVVCGFCEHSKERKDAYIILEKSEKCLAKRDLRWKTRDELITASPDWKSFEVSAIVELFENSAGSINLEWPADAEPCLQKSPQ